jgi:hypothetical protein
VGFLDLFRGKTPEGDPLSGGADGFFDVLGAGGHLVRYTPHDFDEIWATTDEREAGRHVGLGWILLDEVAAEPRGDGRGVLERAFSSGIGEGVGWDRRSGDGVDLGIGPGKPFASDGAQAEGVTTYILGYLIPGRTGSALD